MREVEKRARGGNARERWVSSPAAGALLALAAIVGRGDLRAQGFASASWTEATDPVRIADELYYVGTRGLSSFLFTTDQGHVLLDATLAENVPLVLANIRRLGFDPSDIRFLIASHAHFDHVGGMAAMLEATGAELVLSEADAPFVAAGADFGLGDLTAGYPSAAPARTIAHLDTVRVGDLALVAHITPGHTPGCTSWGGEVHIAGVPRGFVSVCSLSVLPNYRIVGADPTYPGQARDYCRSVAHLGGLTPDIFLGAHPGWFGLPEKAAAAAAGDREAFVDPDGYRAYVSEAGAAIEKALREAGVAGGCTAVVGPDAAGRPGR